ncbi:type I restriction endonuclease subunit R [Geobacter sulfurreducens subsp. ethanolicus]|uniref:type I restriction endonuclease subunit R n=1 Tax=Geobacter sulfurreducens TaxID=35554 RepID=UPI002573289B|nr:DEAD/DEAH box helicase family protein [Geobacter sulfurreducens]BEH09869.1 type I restriction endonuclease subunit R [Geobacter sulfurreducens subsp. ethanolicus]
MVTKTNEQALEACIEKALTGTYREQLKLDGVGVAEANEQYRSGHLYWLGDSGDFDREFAIDRRHFWNFLEATQAEELAKIKDRPNWQRLVLERLSRKIEKDGILKVLKGGLRIDDAHFTLLYSQPYNTINPEVAKRFEQNIFSVTRQVHYSQADPLKSIDMVIFINGIAVATFELKNAWTGQSTYHAMKQYREDRDPNEPLLQFGRCLVHFAVDTDDIYMTTRLDGKKTNFLPFNKGYNHGKGNPPNPTGHKTSYLWQEILTRQSLANIIEHFAKLVGEKESDPLKKKTLYFPRYHQLEVVRKLLTDVRQRGVGQTYLIQHSAGSGKSNSITWTAYQLIEVYTKEENKPVFDSVVVVTDRRVLDKQLKNNIKQFSEVKNIVAHATSSQELKLALESGKKVIITTIQKFPFIVDGIADLSDKRFAVIIDEAHSSQSGSAADNLNRTLGADEDEVQDAILEIMKKRKMRDNASYFAFTATPKNATLERFGEETAEGKFVPFHLYSMKQAIEEGFILDVLANYTTYKSYYEIQKSIRENPLFDSAKAQKKLRAYVEAHKETIAVKADIMVSHFLEQVVGPKKLKGQAKGMVVTRNIETAIRYYFAVRDALKGQPFKAMVAFSGKKKVDGIEYTEETINGFPSKDIEEKFDTDEYRLLVVANKYLTGFDQPKLSAMYVDKKLQGVLAVQALSRLNRCCHALNKRTEDVFILDFFNSTSDIKKAFDPFYTATSLSKATNINVLHDVREKLDGVGVYEWEEVEAFCTLYFSNAEAEQLSPIIDACAARFDHELELEDDEKADFKIKAKQFVKIYAQLACIMPFNNIEWEKLHWFLKFLIPKLKVKDKDKDALDALLESVDLSTYGLERVKLKESIGLDASDSELDPQNPNVRGTHGGDEPKDPLDEIIKAFNERWFAGWEATPEEQRIKFINIAQHVVNNPNYKTQVVDNQDEQNRRIALEKLINNAVSQERKRELDLYKRYAQDPEFKRAFDSSIMRILASQEMSKVVVESTVL